MKLLASFFEPAVKPPRKATAEQMKFLGKPKSLKVWSTSGLQSVAHPIAIDSQEMHLI